MNVEQLSQVISHAMAPVFLLGAVAGFISILMTRMAALIDRSRSLSEIAEDDSSRARLRTEIPRLKRGASLLNNAISLALSAGICTTLLVIVGFTAAFVGFRHESGVGLLFILAVALLGAALFRFAQAVRIGLSELDHYR